MDEEDVREVYAGGALASILAHALHRAFALIAMKRRGVKITKADRKNIEDTCYQALEFCGVDPMSELLPSPQDYEDFIEARGDELRAEYDDADDEGWPEPSVN